MAHYLITLVVETDPAQGSPAGWDWEGLVDSPQPVSVIACTGVADDPEESEVRELHRSVGDLHASWADSLA
jgi:hypothetical protein